MYQLLSSYSNLIISIKLIFYMEDFFFVLKCEKIITLKIFVLCYLLYLYFSSYPLFFHFLMFFFLLVFSRQMITRVPDSNRKLWEELRLQISIWELPSIIIPCSYLKKKTRVFMSQKTKQKYRDKNELQIIVWKLGKIKPCSFWSNYCFL